MIIKLKGATFLNNINGLLNSWPITFYGRTLVTGTFVSSVSKGETYTATFSVADQCTVDSVAITRGGTTMSGATISGSTITISVPTTTESGPISITFNGSKENGDDPVVPEPEEPTTGPVAYTSRQSASGISKTTGEYLSSSTGYVNVYENIDPLKTYAATSYAPGSSGENACVCYYTSDGTFISAESGSDWGISSVEYTMKDLTVPANASTIKLFGRTNNQEAVLYLTAAIAMDEIANTSQNTKSNLNKKDGTLGSSSTGYVNVYDNIDISKTYYASGFAPNATGTAAAVCYYTSDGTFISAQDGNDFGVSSAAFVKQKLTVPPTTYTIKVFAQEQSAYPNTPSAALYIERT